MSGTIASRYVTGLPYDPSQSAAQYVRMPYMPASSGTAAPNLAATLGAIDATGQAVRPGAVGAVGAVTLGDAGGAASSLLSALPLSALPLLGMLQYAPDAINAIDQLVNGAEQTDELPTPPEQMAPPEILGTTPYGMSDIYGQVWGAPVPGQDGLHAIYDGQGRSLGSIDMMQGADDFGDLGAFDPGELGGGADGAVGGAGSAVAPASWSGAIEAAGGFDNAVSAGTLPTDLGLTGALGEVPLLGDLATGGLDILGGAAGGWIASQPFQDSNRPYAQTGQQIGSLAGGIIGQTLIPIPGLGAAAGAAIGGLIGGQGGGLIGPEATIGRNFSSMGTLGGDGNIYWGPTGGDNGGTGQDASAFANWFASDLQRQAAAQGYAINPNMAGTQIRVGGYDNFSRDMQSPAGGYFYDVAPNGGEFAGTPQNYALRPSDDFAYNPYSREQATAFSTNVLADLVARGVYTPGGAASYDAGYLPSTLGADYGWYGSPTGDYSQIEYGGGDFQNVLAGRQNAIQGYLNEQQRAAYEAAVRANTAPGLTDQGYMPAAYDLSQPIFYNGNIVAPGGLGFPTQAAQQNPWAGIGVDAGLIDPGLAGVASNPGGA